MCGIAGLVDFEQHPSREPLGAMLRMIVHRGPDDEGRYDREGFSIGMRRLSILDVQGGHQPIANEDRTVWVVLNGEIYNYIELRADLESRGHRFRTRSDTEVLVHLYEEHGDDLLTRLNGMFGLALWDVRAGRILLARDHLGIKPLYWRYRNGRFVFASELKCFLAGGLPGPDVDREALAYYLHLGYIPRDRSPFRGIRKLRPGHRLVFDRDREPAVSRYWALADAFAAGATLAAEPAAEQAAGLIRDAVRLQLRSDVPLGTFLSGGLDSSSLTVMAAGALPRIDSFGVGFKDHFFDETAYARQVARHAATRHHEQIVDPAALLDHLELLTWHLDEPNADPAMLPSYLICRYARERVKVALSGAGGDEVFAGYPRHYDPPPCNTPASWFREWVPFPLRRAIVRLYGLFDPRRASRLLPDNNAIGMAYWVDQADAALLDEVAPWAQEHFSATEWVASVMAEVPGADWVNARAYYDATTYLPDQILAMTDRASMAVSLEVRVPLLDVRLVELMAGVAGAAKIDEGKAGKVILKRAMRGQLPSGIYDRRKLGFGLPIVRWITAPPVREMLRGLPGGHLARMGLLEGARLEPRLRSEEDLRHHAAFFWNLLMLEMWLLQYVEGERRPGMRGG